MDKIAYLREFEHSNQCVLNFYLNVNVENIGVLNEDINASRQITDSVQSLLQHVSNKIEKLINDLGKENSETTIKPNPKLYVSDAPMKEKTVLKNLFTCYDNMEFEIFEERFLVVINAPLIKEMKLPKLMFADYTIVEPIKTFKFFTDDALTKYFWFKSKDKISWTQISESFKYQVKNSDVDYYLKLKCVPCNNMLTGPVKEVISDSTVQLMGELPKCPFEDRHEFTRKKLADKCVRIVSYNVLSNRYTQRDDDFIYCPPEFLSVDYRKRLIAKELLGYNADIICLQEVDNNIYTNYYKDIFKNENYMTFYHRKGNRIPEGLACFFNKTRFTKLHEVQIIYSSEICKRNNRNFSHLWDFLRTNNDLRELFMRQATSFHVTILKSEGHVYIVGNTHLFYHPDAKLVRLIQICMATTFLYNLVQQYSKHKSNKSVQVILCGDLNSVPTSPVFQFLTKGKIEATHEIFKDCKNSINISHRFNFESACGVPQYTNYTKDFKACLDYIFVEKNKFHVKNIVPFPTEKELSEFEGLPNKVYPSDHLALITDLQRR